MRSSSYTGSCSERPRSPDGSGVNREVHAPFCERPGVKLLRPTHPAASTKMVRLRGRCPRGERLVGSVPHGHWKTITLVAGLRHDAIVAPFVIDGPINGRVFLTYIEQCLAPTLNRGDVVIMDNLRTHKVAGVMEAIEAADATALFLPAYSPDLNPIEQVFSKLKALLRKAAERTVPGLWRRIRSILRAVSENECLNFFRHAGYE